MVCRAQVSLEAELESCAVRVAGRLTGVQLDQQLRARASRRRPSMSPIASRSTPRWFTPGQAAGGAELDAVAQCLVHTTGPM
jgi:hypothetical protein